jgi:hypothetical protein
LYRSSLEALALEFDVEYIDIYPVFCDHSNCFMAKDGELLYRDGNHISRYASSLIAKYVMENSSILKKISYD